MLCLWSYLFWITWFNTGWGSKAVSMHAKLRNQITAEWKKEKTTAKKTALINIQTAEKMPGKLWKNGTKRIFTYIEYTLGTLSTLKPSESFSNFALCQGSFLQEICVFQLAGCWGLLHLLKSLIFEHIQFFSLGAITNNLFSCFLLETVY